MAPAYVSRTFSRDLKISLSAYITRLRIERAKLLLMETNMRIAEIAVSVGIVNRDYFSVLFKKNTGMRPQAYRDCYRQESCRPVCAVLDQSSPPCRSSASR